MFRIVQVIRPTYLVCTIRVNKDIFVLRYWAQRNPRVFRWDTWHTVAYHSWMQFCIICKTNCLQSCRPRFLWWWMAWSLVHTHLSFFFLSDTCFGALLNIVPAFEEVSGYFLSLKAHLIFWWALLSVLSLPHCRGYMLTVYFTKWPIFWEYVANICTYTYLQLYSNWIMSTPNTKPKNRRNSYNSSNASCRRNICWFSSRQMLYSSRGNSSNDISYVLRSGPDILAGEFREGYSPTTPFACLGAPFLNVFWLALVPSRSRLRRTRVSQKWWG